MNNEAERIKQSVELIMKAIRESGQDIEIVHSVLIIANEKLERELK